MLHGITPFFAKGFNGGRKSAELLPAIAFATPRGDDIPTISVDGDEASIGEHGFEGMKSIQIGGMF